LEVLDDFTRPSRLVPWLAHWGTPRLKAMSLDEPATGWHALKSSGRHGCGASGARRPATTSSGSRTSRRLCQSVILLCTNSGTPTGRSRARGHGIRRTLLLVAAKFQQSQRGC